VSLLGRFPCSVSTEGLFVAFDSRIRTDRFDEIF
jgi:hypothetical protein